MLENIGRDKADKLPIPLFCQVALTLPGPGEPPLLTPCSIVFEG